MVVSDQDGGFPEEGEGLKRAALLTALFYLGLVLGWWGIPWGFILTPVQIGRNIYGIIKGPDPMAPSEGLEKAVRVILAAQAVSRQQSQPNPPPA